MTMFVNNRLGRVSEAPAGFVPNKCVHFGIGRPNCPTHAVMHRALVRKAKSTMGARFNNQMLTGCSMTHHAPRSDATVRKTTVFSTMRLAARTLYLNVSPSNTL